MNGKNVNANGVGIAVPLGILEVAAAVVTLICFCTYQTAANVANPVAFADAAELLFKGDGNAFKAAVRDADEYPQYLGNYIEERAQYRFGFQGTEAIEFTLLDEKLLEGIVDECVRGQFTDITLPNNFNGTACNLITFSGNCVCAGTNTPADHKSCLGFSDQKYILEGDNLVKDESVYGTCINHGGLDAYIDTRDFHGKVATNELYTFCQLYLGSALIMSVMRAVARLLFPGELKKPGAMWVNGIPAGILMLMVSCRAMKLFNAWSGEDSLKYFSESDYMFGAAELKGSASIVPFVEHSRASWDSFKFWACLGAWLNIACSFFSDYSYCNDVTTLAYTKDNLKMVKERARKTKLASF